MTATRNAWLGIGIDVCLQHVADNYSEVLGRPTRFREGSDSSKGEPILLAERQGGSIAVLLTRFTEPVKSDRWRFWAMMPAKWYEAMQYPSPRRFDYWHLQLGTNSDWSIRWSALFAEADLMANPALLEPLLDGQFYRADPRLLLPRAVWSPETGLLVRDETPAEPRRGDPQSDLGATRLC